MQKHIGGAEKEDHYSCKLWLLKILEIWRKKLWESRVISPDARNQFPGKMDIFRERIFLAFYTKESPPQVLPPNLWEFLARSKFATQTAPRIRAQVCN